MKAHNRFTYIFIIFFFIGGCKAPENKVTENENSIEIIVSCGEDSNLERYINEGWVIKKENNIEIIVSCGEDSNLQKHINDGWKIKNEYSEEKVCSWKTIAASKDCDLEKDKGCKIVQPNIIGEETIYLLEK